MKKLLILFSVLFITSCKGQGCETLPQTYSSYKKAVATITKASFTLTASADTSSSSWIMDADFYSCDGANGFLVIEIKSKKYIYKGVPRAVWNAFKASNSLGTFYNSRIKNNYKMPFN